MADPSINALIGEVVSADPEMRNEVRELVRHMIEYARYTMDFGTPADKAVLMRAAVPSMMKALQAAEDTERQREQARAYERIMTATGLKALTVTQPVTLES